MANGDFDLSQILSSSDLDPSLISGLGDLAGTGASALDSYQDSSLSYPAQAGSDYAIGPTIGKASLSKAVRLLGAALSYYGSGALQGILPSLATALGVQSQQLLLAFLSKKSRGRGRRRGITYRQLSNARRVYNTIGRMYHRLHKGEHRASRPPPYHTMKKRSR